MKKEFTDKFINHLTALVEGDRGAAATLRRSLAFQPGTWPPAFPYVEKWMQGIQHADDPMRRAAYLVAGMIAQHGPHSSPSTFAAVFGRHFAKNQTPSLERRFINLLEADEQQMPYHLRQAVTLLGSDEYRFDYASLFNDLTFWSHPDRFVQQKWAREYYSKPNIPSSTNDKGEAA